MKHSHEGVMAPPTGVRVRGRLRFSREKVMERFRDVFGHPKNSSFVGDGGVRCAIRWPTIYVALRRPNGSAVETLRMRKQKLSKGQQRKQKLSKGQLQIIYCNLLRWQLCIFGGTRPYCWTRLRNLIGLLQEYTKENKYICQILAGLIHSVIRLFVFCF